MFTCDSLLVFFKSLIHLISYPCAVICSYKVALYSCKEFVTGDYSPLASAAVNLQTSTVFPFVGNSPSGWSALVTHQMCFPQI